MVKPKTNKYLLSIMFVLIGTGFLYFALTTPCEVGPIRTVTEQLNIEGLPNNAEINQDVSMELPTQVKRAICIYTDFDNILLFLLGAALTTTGTASFVKKATS
jgi:hypothetical protein